MIDLKDFEKQMKMMSGGNNPNIPNLMGYLNPFKSIKKWFNKNRKKIIIYTVITTTLIFGVKYLISEKKGVYMVVDSTGVEYNTNDYDLTGQCVKFKRNRGSKLITICGNFKIVKQQNK